MEIQGFACKRLEFTLTLDPEGYDARGIDLPEDEEARVMNSINSLAASTQPSLLLDLLAGSPTEVDVLSGAIARFAEQEKIETPIHDAAAIAFAQRKAN